MKSDIHPKYEVTTVTCACGEVIHTRSTKKNIRVEICSKCHPFYTGKQKLMDSAGRVEKFMKKYGDRKSATPKKAKTKPEEMKLEAENTEDKQEQL